MRESVREGAILKYTETLAEKAQLIGVSSR